MDFPAVVERARRLHSEGIQDAGWSADMIDGSCSQVDRVFGRICNTDDPSPPNVLSTTPGRQTVFVFGPDSINSIILHQNAYDCLRSLGFDREYIHHEVVEKKCRYWLVLFTSTALACTSVLGTPQVVMATWDGVLHVLQTYYTEAYEDTVRHLGDLLSKSVHEFEQEAGFEFLDSKKNIDCSIPNAPSFHSYNYYITLPKPRKAWQVRLFLYCELRLLSLFKGDGYTWTENGSIGTQEYFCPNLSLSAFDPAQIAVIPMTVTIPNEH